MATTPYTFSPGETRVYPKCKYFRIESAVDSLLCVFFGSNGNEIGRADLSQGQAVNYPDGFATVEVTSATGQAVEIHTLPFVLSSNSVVGDVNALTRFENLTKNGNRFWTGQAQAATVGSYGQIAIYNPVGSGVKTYIDVLRLNAKGVSIEFYKIGSADLPSFLATLDIKNKQLGGVDAMSKKLVGMAGSKIGTLQYISIGTDFYGTPAPLDLKNSPIELDEGEGINFICNAVETAITVFAELWEE